MKVLVFPQNATDPYQSLLYAPIAASGVQVRFVASPTRSQTGNLLLLPALLLSSRCTGHQILHLHWIYPFAPAWVGRIPVARRLFQGWFRVFLASARLLGYRIVWTAHNVLPHAPVLADDEAGRRLLAREATAVIAHSRASIPALEAFGATRIVAVPMGPAGAGVPRGIGRDEARSRLGLPRDGRVVAFVGTIGHYKGADLLLAAARGLPAALGLRLVVAGACDDAALAQRLHALAGDLEGRATLRLGRVPTDELQVYLESADVVAFPFRSITNSSSLLLALEFGRPVLLPDLPELAGCPEDVAFRYDPGDPEGLGAALAEIARADEADLAARGAASAAAVAGRSWDDAARATVALYRSVLERRTEPGPHRADASLR